MKKISPYDLVNYGIEESGEICFIQHSLDREGGDLLDAIDKVAHQVETIVIIMLPMDIFSIKIPEYYRLKHLIYSRRPRHRLWNDLGLISCALCFCVLSTRKNPKRSIPDMCDMELAFEQICNAYSFGEKPIYLTRTNSSIVSMDLYSDELLIKLSEKILNPIILNK